jgi:PleD family two-component response regulator
MTTLHSPRPILLATDDSNDVFTLWRYHKECRIHNRLEVVSDGEDILRYLESNRMNYPPPALLIAGMKLPRVGGLEILRHLEATRQRDFSTVLLIDTKDHDLEVVMKAYRLGAHAFLMRPLVRKEFCGLISRLEAVKMDGCPREDGATAE